MVIAFALSQGEHMESMAKTNLTAMLFVALAARQAQARGMKLRFRQGVRRGPRAVEPMSAMATSFVTKGVANATDEVQKGGALLHSMLDNKLGWGQGQKAGVAAEVLVATKFNEQAALQGSHARAQVLANNGPADIAIAVDGTWIADAQVKVHTTAKRTAVSISDPKYEKMQKIVPSDQVEQARAIAGERAKHHGENHEAYADSAKRASANLEGDGVVAGATEKRESIAASKNPTGTAAVMNFRAGLREVAVSTGAGAIVGAALGGTISAVKNSISVAQGEKEVGDAILDTAKDAGVCAAKGAAVGFIGSALRVTAARAGCKLLARSNVALTFAAVAVESGIAWTEYASGKITVGQACARQTGAVGGGGGALAGMALGTALCPGVGTIAGAIVGGLLGEGAFRWIGSRLFA